MTDMPTAVTAPMSCTARGPHAASHNSDAHTLMSVCRKSGSAMARTTARMVQTRRWGMKVKYISICRAKKKGNA